MIPPEISLYPFDDESGGKVDARPKLFLKDPKADLYIMVSQQIFPIHRRFMGHSQTINQYSSSEKFFTIPKAYNFDLEIFKNVLGLFYGIRLQAKGLRQIEMLLEILDFLNVQPLINQVQKQILVSLDSYDVFYIMNIAYLFGLRAVYERCFQNLKNQQYQQMLYNKFDFMHCHFKLFQIVLRSHQVLQVKEQIVGIHVDMIQEIIELYCSTQGYNEQTKNKISQRYGIRQNAKQIAESIRKSPQFSIRESNQNSIGEDVRISNRSAGIRESNKSRGIRESKDIRQSSGVRQSNKSKKVEENTGINGKINDIQESQRIKKGSSLQKSDDIRFTFGKNNQRILQESKNKMQESLKMFDTFKIESADLKLNKYVKSLNADQSIYEGIEDSRQQQSEDLNERGISYNISINTPPPKEQTKQEALDNKFKHNIFVKETESIRNSNPGKNRRLSQQLQTIDFGYFPFIQKNIEKSHNINQYLTNPAISENKKSESGSKSKSSFEPPKIEDDPEDMVGKISTLLSEYENAAQQHDTNLQNMKKKSQVMKSLILNDGGQTNIETDRNIIKDAFGSGGGFKLNQGEGQLFKNITQNNLFETQQIQDLEQQ